MGHVFDLIQIKSDGQSKVWWYWENGTYATSQYVNIKIFVISIIKL